MPPSITALTSAPPAPLKNLATPTADKSPSDSGTSFHDTLIQIKNKSSKQSAIANKPPVAAKPAAKPARHKATTASKQAKPLTEKSAPPKAPQPTTKKPDADDPTNDSQHDAHDNSQEPTDPSAQAPDDQPTNSDPTNDPTDAIDQSALTTAQLNLAAQQAAVAKQPAPNPTDDSKDQHDPHDHHDKKDSDSTASSDSTSDASAVAGQLTAQAITAVKQTSDQPTPKNSPAQDQTSETSNDDTVSPATSQATTTTTAPTKSHARAVQSSKDATTDPDAQSPDSSAAQPSTQPTSQPTADTASVPTPKSTIKSIDDVLGKSQAVQGLMNSPTNSKTDSAKSAASPHPPGSPEARFAEANHPNIISEIQGKLLPNGGSMDIHLTPQDLGSVHVRVEVRDGSITATFHAADNDTAKLLTHSLSDLKSSLEAQGIAVEKLHVTHTPNDQHPSQNQNDNQRRNPDPHQQQTFQQDQHRRDMLRRLWRRAMKTPDPLDLVA